MNISIVNFCELFYASHYVPIVLYQGAGGPTHFTSLEKPLDLSSRLIPLIRASEKNPDVFTLPDQGQYGIIRLDNQDDYILIGPVFSSFISGDTINAVARNNFIEAKDIPLLSTFLNSIPNYSYNQFLNLIAFMHYLLNLDTFDVIEHFHAGSNVYENSIANIHTENSYMAKEYQLQHETYQYESTLLSYVRNGDVDNLNKFLLQTVKTTKLREGTLADTPLRQAKNLLIGLVTMVGKIGAISGGLDAEETYRLIDLYIQECEKAPSVEAVKMLQFNMIMNFTERVAQNKIPQGISKDMFICMQYIQNHTNCTIGIDDAAAHIGKSRAYLTRKFRKETGMSVTEFIKQSKIRDAKRLLQYSEKPLSEISNYLCFSSQAYFQTVFKNDTGFTPNKYRQKHSIFF